MRGCRNSSFSYLNPALHIFLLVFSIATGATSATFVFGHAPPWVFSCTTTVTTLTTFYSACYVLFYNDRSHFLSIRALVLLALFWYLALILPWISVPYAVYRIALLTEWTPLAHASLGFCILSIAILALIPPASYYRYRADAAGWVPASREAFRTCTCSIFPISPSSFYRRELFNHHAPTPLSHNGFSDITDHPDDYIFRELHWLQQSDIYSHQFIVMMFEHTSFPADKLYVRVEREKAKWTSGGSLETLFTTSSFEEVLTRESFCVARYTIGSPCSRAANHTLRLIGEVIDDINRYSSNYSLLAYNCWWFASCSFICIAHHIQLCGPKIYCRRESHHQLEETKFDKAMTFCYIHYLRGHWLYWILVVHPLVILTAGLTLISNWCYLAYTIPPAFMAAWLTYYIVSIARSWGVVRGVVGRHGNAVGVCIACRGAIVVVGLMLYGAICLALASNPDLAITAQTVSRGL
ncbi:hypothetical protein FRB94_007958 [Tulasnella sp. JGI-2019a]|nr:hypothetical protein FRB94_007958 [Tulasnella sp. JGI-2019a]